MTESSAKTLTLIAEGRCADPLPLRDGTAKPITGSSKPHLWIRTAAGPSIGYGHLKRSLVLAKRLEGSVQPVFLLDSSDVGSRSQVAAQGWRIEPFKPIRLWSRLPLPDGVLIDTRETTGLVQLVEGARAREIPVLSIHDLGLNPLPSDVVIDGSILPSSEGFCHSDASLYTGTSYLVLEPVYAFLHEQPRRISARIESLVVNLGGGDSGGCFVKVLEGLRLWGRDIEVVGVPGFACWGQSELARSDWGSVHFRWATPDESLAHLLFRADLAVTAGGLAAFEALCAGTPAMALSVDKHQHITVQTLARSGACAALGFMNDFKPVQLPELISKIDADRAKRGKMSRSGRRIVDGLGAERVSHIIQQCVFKHSGTGRAGKSE
ncbi:MAG TPA: hypothetical protein VE398_12185 [Acidobacteriota bacterium]|nr:hypothetical protein [Acidobacteriota bacterium]